MEHIEDQAFRRSSALSATVKKYCSASFRSVDVSSLVSLIATKMLNGVHSSSLNTLVNVYSPFSGFSRGFIKPPDIYPACHILFTFETRTKVGKLVHLSNQCYVWDKYISVGITSVEAAKLGILTDRLAIHYLYQLVGIVYRSIILHYTKEDILDFQLGKVNKQTYNPFKPKDIYLTLPFSAAVRMPYWSWKFSKEVWETAPNLILVQDVDEYLTLYYFLFISKNLSKITTQDDGLFKLIRSIKAVIVKSLMRYVQYINDPNDYQFEVIDLLAPNLLCSLIFTGKSDLVLTKDSYLQELKENLVSLTEHLDKQAVLSYFISSDSYEDCAMSIIFSDQQRLLTLLK